MHVTLTKVGYIGAMHDALSRFPLLVIRQSRQELPSAKTELLPQNSNGSD